MRSSVIKNISRVQPGSATSEQLTMSFGLEKSILSLSDSLARIFQLQENGQVLKAHKAVSFMKRHGLSELSNLIFLSLKMSKDFSLGGRKMV